MANDWREVLQFDPCVHCGEPMAALDHIVPASRGGSDEWENMAPICRRCNSRKSTIGLLQFLWRLRSEELGLTRRQVIAWRIERDGRRVPIREMVMYPFVKLEQAGGGAPS